MSGLLWMCHDLLLFSVVLFHCPRSHVAVVIASYNLSRVVLPAGTGSNAAYMEQLSNVEKWTGAVDEPKQVLRMHVYVVVAETLSY